MYSITGEGQLCAVFNGISILNPEANSEKTASTGMAGFIIKSKHGQPMTPVSIRQWVRFLRSQLGTCGTLVRPLATKWNSLAAKLDKQSKWPQSTTGKVKKSFIESPWLADLAESALPHLPQAVHHIWRRYVIQWSMRDRGIYPTAEWCNFTADRQWRVDFITELNHALTVPFTPSSSSLA